MILTRLLADKLKPEYVNLLYIYYLQLISFLCLPLKKTHVITLFVLSLVVFEVQLSLSFDLSFSTQQFFNLL